MERGNPLLDDYVLGLTGKLRPKVCFLPTASGDADHYVVRFYQEFAKDRADATHLTLFRRDRAIADVREHLLAQDLIYVGGGSLVSLLGVWKAHGIDSDPPRGMGERRRSLWSVGGSALLVHRLGHRLLRRAGASRRDGIPSVELHRPLRHRARAPRRSSTASSAAGCDRATPPTMSLRSTSAGLELHKVVSSRPGAGAASLSCGSGGVVERRIEADYLGAPVPQIAPVPA